MFKSVKIDIYIFWSCVLLLIGEILFPFSKESHADVAQKQILTLEKIIELPSSPAVAAWNADGTQMLVNIPYIYRKPYHSVVRIIDINTGTIGKPIGALGSLWGAKLHWSPKGDYLLVNRTGGSILFSYPALKKLGVAQSSDTGVKGSSGRCRFTKSTAFTHDNKAIWVSCGAPGRGGIDTENWVVAVKISVPRMKIIKQVIVPVPQQGTARFTGFSRISVRGKRIILDARLEALAVPRTYVSPKMLKQERYFASYDLEKGIPLYKVFKVTDTGFSRGGLSYSVKNKFLVSKLGLYQKGDGLPFVKSVIATINPQTHQTIHIFDEKKFGAIQLMHPLLSEDGHYLFSRFHKADKKPFLGVWDIKELNLIQSFQTLAAVQFRWFKQSPDGRRLAGIAKNKIYIYKISQHNSGE